MQTALNRAYGTGTPAVLEEDARAAVAAAIESENATYKAYCEMLPRGQLAVLKAVATERTVSKPLGKAFIARHSLGAASSIRQALQALEQKALVLRDEAGAYSVYDRFLGLWLTPP